MAGPGFGQNVFLIRAIDIVMKRNGTHITLLFKQFAFEQQQWLSKHNDKTRPPVNRDVALVLSRYQAKEEVFILRQALLDPYFPLGMLERTLFADVVGMRFFINKKRPDLEPALAVELLEWAAAFLRIRHDIQTVFNPETITCIPVDGMRHNLPSGQWCTLCGVCCQIGGVPPNPPAGIQYPDHWYRFLSGEAIENQQLCPFLLQYFGESRFFCAIHNIKPMACRQFGQNDCHQRLDEGGLHTRSAPAPDTRFP
jgi:hypothetical protein